MWTFLSTRDQHVTDVMPSDNCLLTGQLVFLRTQMIVFASLMLNTNYDDEKARASDEYARVSSDLFLCDSETE
jgi:hypothetical protein